VKLSGGVEWAVHCCVVLAVAEDPVPVAILAELHDVSTTYLAKQLQALSRAGIVRSTQGRSGGYLLTREPALITMLDVVEAVDGQRAPFVCTEIRQRGPLAVAPDACNGLCGINRAMLAADHAWRDSLRSVTLADIAKGMRRQYAGDMMGTVATWLSDRTSASAAG
jgi:Rrf2 family protein